MGLFTHALLFFFGMAVAFFIQHGLARSPDSTENQYFVSAVLSFIDHKGNHGKHYYAGTFKPESRNPSAMAEEFRNSLLKLVTKEMPEEVFQLSDKNNYRIQIYSMNKV